MEFQSTKSSTSIYTLSNAIELGMAPDGGLIIPRSFPKFTLKDFAKVDKITDIAKIFLQPFFSEDVLEKELDKICEYTFNFPIVLSNISAQNSLLELYHGPTAAFKDVGARFLSQCLQKLAQVNNYQKTILVATSGDTGSAVAAAFHGCKGFKVVILFPKGKVSQRQKHLLCCFGDNVKSIEVDGDFDDCQTMVKKAFLDKILNRQCHLTSANSINIARLLPQCVYYVAASIWHYREKSNKANFIVPTGNMGNVLACYWARHMGLPIADIVMATNANKTITKFLQNGNFIARKTISTVANAMDVGNPSNIERFTALYPNVASMEQKPEAYSINDNTIKETIKYCYKNYGVIACPHTAAALSVMIKLPKKDWIVTATAHASKFEKIVEPLINTQIPLPKNMDKLLKHKINYVKMDNKFSSLREMLTG